jgi:hypothetical protein
MSEDDDFRYRNVLEKFGEFARDFQDYKLAREKALNELEQRLTAEIQFYWRATSAALRQLSDWHAKTENKADRERTIERWIQRTTAVVIILLLLFDIYFRSRGP